MCYTDLQHYSHCKHTEVKFISCWDPDSQIWPGQSHERNRLRGQSHMYNALCPWCLIEHLRFVVGDYAPEGTSVDVVDVDQYVKDNGDKSAVEVIHQAKRLMVNRWDPINEKEKYKHIKPKGCIDHDERLLEDCPPIYQTLPSHQHLDWEAPESRISLNDAWIGYVNFALEDDASEETEELLMFFKSCSHYNLISTHMVQKEGGNFSECHCGPFDVNFKDPRYAEGVGPCLVCTLHLNTAAIELQNHFAKEYIRMVSEEYAVEWLGGKGTP